MKRALFLLCLVFPAYIFSQSIGKGAIIVNTNIGAPHLYKGIVKLATQSDVFKKQFSGKLDVNGFSGLYPVSFRAEYGINKYFGIGLSGAMWTMKFNVVDQYNVLHAGQVTGTDEIDTYKFKLTSSSIGIRPNLHIPFKNTKSDLYLGFGLGMTSNKLEIDFSSTDVNKVFPNLSYELSLPGGLYFSPTLGYRHYFANVVGMNIELGYDKGAIVQGGIVFRFNHSGN